MTAGRSVRTAPGRHRIGRELKSKAGPGMRPGFLRQRSFADLRGIRSRRPSWSGHQRPGRPPPPSKPPPPPSKPPMAAKRHEPGGLRGMHGGCCCPQPCCPQPCCPQPCCPQFCGGPPRSPQPAPCGPPPERPKPGAPPRSPGPPPCWPPGPHDAIGPHGAAPATPWPKAAANARLPHITAVAIIVRCRTLIFITGKLLIGVVLRISLTRLLLTPKKTVRCNLHHLASKIDGHCQAVDCRRYPNVVSLGSARAIDYL
jgi:hypothetical protein